MCLKAEIEKYKKLLGIGFSSEVVETEATNGINKYSSSKDKIALFRSLFRGREDVFARRWYSKTTDKSGYQPVCTNEWTHGICDKKKYKCSVCPNRELLPLSDKDIFDHLSGKDEYGRVTQLIKILTSAVTKGISVMIITRPPSDFKEKEQKNVIDITTRLEEYGIKVTYRSGFHQKFTVIDNEIVWYGSVNFLSFGIAEESIMRFTNQDIAGQLLDTISEI